MKRGKPILGPALTLLAAVIVLFAAAPASGAYELVDKLDRPSDLEGDRRFVPGEVLVRFRPSIGQNARASALERVDAKVKERPPVPGLQLVAIDRTTSVQKASAELEQERGVRYAEPNFIYRIQATPSDPRFDELWGLDNSGQGVSGISGTPDADIDAPEAWETTTGSNDVTVAVVDTGIANNHPDLAPNIWANPGETGGGKQANGIDDDGNGLVDDWRGWDYYRSDNDPSDLNGHGSHVAGTIGARGDDGHGVAGVNWQVGLMSLRVCSARGLCPTSAIVSAFGYADAEGAKAVNVSLGGRFSYALHDAIARAPDTLFVVAAGNVSYDMDSPYSSRKQYPCGYELSNIICVAATTQDDELADFSSYGLKSVDLGAPGTNILSTWPAYATLYSEGFEGDISATWTTGGRHDTWARTDEAAASGSFSLTDSPGAWYLGDTDSFAQTTDPIDLSAESGCKLHYKARLDLVSPVVGAADLWVYASTDGSSWSPLAGWTGDSGGEFLSFVNDASMLDGRESAYLRFRLRSYPAVTDGDGAHVDDVEIRCRTSSYAGGEFEFLQGTSMATPHVTGAAALLWALRPEASPSAVKGALLANVDPTPSLEGKIASGGRLNADIDRLAAPLITGTDPDSPADETEPMVRGWIGTSTPGEVELYRNANCGGAPAATGSDEQFVGAGIQVSVPENVATALSARVMSPGGGGSACSEPLNYVEDSNFPASFIYWANAGGSSWPAATTGPLGRANLDGSAPDQSFGGGTYGACGVALDERSIYSSGVFVYGSGGGRESGLARIMAIARAQRDGSAAETIISGITEFVASVRACGVAVGDTYVYWADQPTPGGDGSIGRANLCLLYTSPSPRDRS